ncbi:MAG: methylmalonyl-CoA mutase subunit beta [Balneolaceae bacterium]
MSISNLFDEFPQISREEWEKRIEQDLNEEDYKAQLKWKTSEGFEVLPFYMKEDTRDVSHLRSEPGSYPFTRGNNKKSDWQIAERIEEDDPATARQNLLRLLEQDVDLVQFNTQATPDDGMLGGDITGLNLQSSDDFAKLTEGADLKNAGFIFDSGMTSPVVLAMMNSTGKFTANRRVFFTYDPYTYTARTGRNPLPEDELHSVIRQFSRQSVKGLSADGLFYHRCGATIVQELAISLAIGSEYLASYVEQETDLTAICHSFWMRLSAGSLYFPEIAKFRAARMLWSKITEAYGLKPEIGKSLHIHAEPSSWNKTAYDPYTNMLRSTTETMSAVIGGANSILALPYNSVQQSPDPFSKRIARNVHHILKHETFLDKVTDPAAGSWYVEKLTDQIAENSWSFFQMIEKQGGLLKALKGGTVQTAINDSKHQKRDSLAHRTLISVGINHYPDPEEKLQESLYRKESAHSLHKSDRLPEINPKDLFNSLKQAFQNGAVLGDLISYVLNPDKQMLTSLAPSRLTLPFEQLREATQDYENKHGKKPSVLLLPVGNKKNRNARALYARNVLGCLGYEIHENFGYDTLQQGLKETSSIHADLTVLCSSDEEYIELVKPFCDTFKNSDTLRLLVGNPNENRTVYRESGIDYFIYSGSDILKILSKIQKQLGLIDKTNT